MSEHTRATLVEQWRDQARRLRRSADDYGVGGLSNFIKSGWREKAEAIETCADQLEAALRVSGSAPSAELLAIHGEHHAATFEECGHWRCQDAPKGSPNG